MRPALLITKLLATIGWTRMCAPRCRSTLTIGTRESPKIIGTSTRCVKKTSDTAFVLQGKAHCHYSFFLILFTPPPGPPERASGGCDCEQVPSRGLADRGRRVSPEPRRNLARGRDEKARSRAMRLLMFLAERAARSWGSTELIDEWGRPLLPQTPSTRLSRAEARLVDYSRQALNIS